MLDLLPTLYRAGDNYPYRFRGVTILKWLLPVTDKFEPHTNLIWDRKLHEPRCQNLRVKFITAD